MSPTEDNNQVDEQTAGVDIDPEIKEIFVEEAGDVLATLQEVFPAWRQEPDNSDALTETRRAFHTLKGSGRMVAAEAIGELAWSVENMLNKVIDRRIDAGEDLMAVVAAVIELVPAMVAAFDAGNSDYDQGREAMLREAATALANGEAVSLDLDTGAGTELAADYDPDLLEIFISEARSHLAALADYAGRQRDKAPFYEVPTQSLQAALHTFKGSAHMASVDAVARLATPLEKLVKELLSYQLTPSSDCVALLSDCAAYGSAAVDALAAGQTPATDELDGLIARLQEMRQVLLSPVQGADQSRAVDPALLNLLMAEGMQNVLDADTTLADWRRSGRADPAVATSMAQELEELQEAGAKAGFPALAELAGALSSAYSRLSSLGGALQPAGYDLLLEGHDNLLNMADAIAAHQDVLPAEKRLLQGVEALAEAPVAIPDVAVPALSASELEVECAEAEREVLTLFVAEAEDLLDELERAFDNWRRQPAESAHAQACNRLLHTVKGSARMAGLESLGTLAHDMETAVATVTPSLTAGGESLPSALLSFADVLHQAVARVSARLQVAEPAATAGDTPLPEDIDREIVDLFMTEAGELMEELEATLQGWLESPEDATLGDVVKRNLHTFKGGARMAGLLDLGEQAHHLETFVVGSELKVLRGKTAPVQEMLRRFDALQTSLEAVQGALAAQGLEKPAEEPQEPRQPVWQTAEILPFTGKYKGLYPQKQQLNPDVQQTSQEVVRIPAPELDALVNLAGESSISRSQVEQNINEFIFSLDEMEATIGRMQDQVRRLGIETDAQVMFRREQIEASDDGEGFDPLEMDRYSQLQQLSRSLLESASDLHDLRDTLVDKSRDAESLLLQQSRINTDLQEGLMRTRMVPFSRIVPRLRRVVRQVGGTVGKEVNLQLGNVEGELDRSVLERIMAPLEHMLRNAIDHGIESADERREMGKDAEGTISLSFARDGADILIRLADDGRGLNVDAIREKAFSLGLLNENQNYSENELAQFIFHPGFSTASEVTQTSGRGVGMDVVHSEVRQLGGAVTMTTRRGAGTEFTVRLPFTVSVNRALMIELGEDSYSLALNSIAGVTRMSVAQLTHFYNNPDQQFEYGGEHYDVRYLGTLLSSDLRPTLDTALGQLPVVLIRVDNRNYAVQVDALIGSREIVVKSLGPQFSRVPGLSGATVLGDGRVVVILDLQGLLRDQSAATVLTPVSAEELAEERAEEERHDDVQTIMVVDDSVTVRKVTGRFLEREGFRVVTARDGVDAMRALQETTPDLMLLDIEMPRMDGFEVARLVRSTQRLKDLPIIMITSRTGEKHRERALAMGVNQYLGKPYQEEVLIREVYGLLTSAETG